MFLTAKEIVELTGRCTRPAQVRALRFMCIEHKIRPDGSVAVSRAHVEQVLGVESRARRTAEIEPNWSAI